MADTPRIITLQPGAAVQQIAVNSEQPIALLGQNLSFWGEGSHLMVYENGELRAVLQDYYRYFDGNPVLDSASGQYLSIEAPPAPVQQHALLASQTDSHFAGPVIHGQESFSPAWLIGGVVFAGGAAAAAAGGGGDDDDEDAGNGDNPALHNGSVTAVPFSGETVSSTPYFIDVLASNERVGFLGDAQKWAGPGQPATITYSFADSPLELIYGVALNYSQNYQAFNDTQKQHLRQLFAHYAQYANIEFKEVDEDLGADVVLYLDDLTSSPGYTADTLAYAYYGGNLHIHSTLYGQDDFSPNSRYTWAPYNDTVAPYQSGYSVALHELGHVLGLDHPFYDDSGALKPGWNQAEDLDITTVMTYNAHESIAELMLPGSQSQYYKDVAVYQSQLGIYDIAALNYLYGVNSQFNSADNTYTFASFDYKANAANGAIDNVYIVDGGGNDTIDASNQRADVFIDLTSGSWNYAGSKAATLAIDANGNSQSGQLFIGFGSQIENAKGGSGNDSLNGNSADNFLYGYAGNDTLNGGAGNDQLEGGQGSDILIGGSGNDSFLFRSQFDGSADTIKDFNAAEGDLIHLGQTVFGQLGLGVLAEKHFVLGEAAADGDDFFVFNSGNGQLLYDNDGNGANAAVHLATLENTATLSASQIFIV